MSTITQLENSITQHATNEPEHALSGDHVRKLLLIDCLPSDSSSELIDKLQQLDSSALEVSHKRNDLCTIVDALQPDVLFLSVDMLESITLEQLIKIHQTCPLPVIVVAKRYAPRVLENVVTAGVSSYLVDEVSLNRLIVIVDMSIARFKQEQLLISELQVTKEKLSERKLIERAKGIIMKQKQLSEEDAYSQMRKSAMNQGQSMADLAKRIISVY